MQVVRLRGDQSYTLTDGTPARTNGTIVIPGKPGTATEKILVTVDARDTSVPRPGKRVNQYKESIANTAYFKDNLAKTNGGVLLTGQSAPQMDQSRTQPFVMFTLQCIFPEKTR